MNHWIQLLSTSFALFLLMDPIGNVPIFVSVLKGIEPKRQRLIIFRELIIALIIIISFNFLGEILLTLLNVQKPTLLISGGLILFLIALRMIFPLRKEVACNPSPDKEPFIVPMAVPLVAGPAVLAAVMLYANQDQSDWITVGAICIAWTVSTVILILSPLLQKLLGSRGLIACERLMGLLLVLISVQMFLEGILLFIQESHVFTS